MEDIERIREHLENIQNIEPIITSLRTISAGGWRLATRRLEATAQYVEHLSEILATLLPDVPDRWLAQTQVLRQPTAPRKAGMLVIASERGLCGAFNDIVLEGAERLIAQQQLQSEEVRIMTLGSRAEAHFRAQGRDLFFAEPLPVTRVAPFDLVRELGQELAGLLDKGEFDAVYVIHSPYKPNEIAPPVAERWLPLDASILPSRTAGWPPPIFETDKRALFQRIIEEWILVRLFYLVMDSAASEQSARYRAMEAASSNLTRIIDELTLSYHTARQHAITMQMLDLVAGSGILRKPSERG